MTDTENIQELDTEDEDLSYVKDIRKKLISATFVNGKPPVDKIEAHILLDNLNAIERVAMQKRKIKSDQNKSKSNEALAVSLARLIRQEVDPSKEAVNGGEIPEFPVEDIESFDIPAFETADYKDTDYKTFKNANGMD